MPAMMKAITVALAASATFSLSAAGQARGNGSDTLWTPMEREFRAAAINAVLSFRSDLSGDSTKVAACRITSAVQDSAAAIIAATYRHLLIEPLTPQRQPFMACSVAAFEREGVRVLWLEDLIEVQRRGESDNLRARVGPAGGIAFEASFQLLVRPGHRLFERYEIRPTGPAGSTWRVTKYELLGEEFSHAHSRTSTPP
jgi:hypothetical protein